MCTGYNWCRVCKRCRAGRSCNNRQGWYQIRQINMSSKPEEQARCVFEYIYFARPDSNFDGISVYHSRIMAGKILGNGYIRLMQTLLWVFLNQEMQQQWDMQWSQEFLTELHLSRNSYVGRTFIKPQQKSRESSVRVKLNVLKEAVKRQASCND